MELANKIEIREAYKIEFKSLAELIVEVYSQLDGFPKRKEQPDYYKKLSGIGEIAKKKGNKLLVAVSAENRILGGVAYFGNMKHYGSGGSAAKVSNASGIRLLAVHPDARGMGIGKALTQICIQKAKEKNHSQVILHTTKAMQTAWIMYEKIGFIRSSDLDFKQQGLHVFGFRFVL